VVPIRLPAAAKAQ